jgi:hypothetical protein
MKTAAQKPVDIEGVAPVTILDSTGRVVQTITADEFRRIHGIPERPKPEMLRRRKGRSRPSEPVQDAEAVDDTALDEADHQRAIPSRCEPAGVGTRPRAHAHV